MNPISLFFQEDAQTIQKTRLFITFTSLIQMEWIKASHVDKNVMYKKKKILNLISIILWFIFLPTKLKFGLFVV